MTKGRNGPPRLAVRLVKLFVPPGMTQDGLLGDLEERFHVRVSANPRRARWWYWREAAGAAGRHGSEAVREAVAHYREGDSVDGWMRDVKLAFRGILRRPAFATGVILTLALGMGANTAVFSVLHTVLLEPLPYDDPQGLVMADQLQTTGFRASVAMPNYQDWRERSRVFEAVSMEKPETVRVDGREGAEVLESRLVLDDFFQLLGRDPVVGRLPTPAELGPGAERVVVLTYGLWQSRFGSRDDVVGETLTIEGEPHRIVAVLPPAFAMDRDVTMYLPLGLRADDPAWSDRSTSFGGWVVARLRPGVSLDEARADMARVTEEMRSSLGADHPGAALFSMRDWYVGDVDTPLLFLMGGAALVLLVACANVASLLLGRAEERQGELALRTALGAGRRSLVRSLLADALVLATLGGLAGLALAAGALRLLSDAAAAMLPLAFAESVSIDGAAVLVMFATVLLVTVVVGVIPAVRGVKAARAGVSRSIGAGRGGARTRGILVGVEVALSVMLLVCTGLLVRSVANLQSIDTGFSSEGVLVQRMSVPRERYPDRLSVAQLQESVREEIARLPGVSSAAVSNLYPFSRTNWEMLFRDPERWPAEDAESVLFTAASPAYFDVFSIRLLRGRLFTDADRADTEPVVVIDETAAERAWPGEDPIGKIVAVDDVPEGDDFVPLWRTVIGVVSHVRNYELTEPSRIEAYVPIDQSYGCCRTVWLTVRTEGDPAALAPAVRRIVRDADPEMPVYRVDTMRAVVDREMAVHRAVQALFVVFGILALALGAVGVYGVVASLTRRRRQEIGLRVALGSTPAAAVGHVAGQGIRWVLAGLVVGIVASTLAGRTIESFLVGVRPWDPAVLVGASLALVLAASAALLLPARRAVREGPAEVLKEE